MKIVFCTSVLKGGSKTRGVGVYTRELITALNKTYPRDQFIESTGNPYTLTSDLVHYPFFDPFYLTLPWLYKRKTVITIHDLIPLKYPEHFRIGLRGRLKWFIQKYRASRSSAIITDSVSSGLDIERLMGIPKSKIHVVPLASSSVATTALTSRKVKRLYKLPDTFILYVGDINWNKNILGLLDAFNRVKDQSAHLVLMGKVWSDKPNIPEFRAIMDKINTSPKKSLIHLLGYIPNHHKGSIYALSTLYVQPSWDEGFGLPILEAMSLGCPVISSNRGSLQEVGGEAVIYFDPGTNELSKKIDDLLSREPKRQELTRLGLIQAKKFSWKATAALTKAIYSKVLSQ